VMLKKTNFTTNNQKDYQSQGPAGILKVYRQL
jgi:hypothetical protein